MSGRSIRVSSFGAVALLAVVSTSLRAWAGEMHSDFEIGQDGTAGHVLQIHGDEAILDGSEKIELLPGEGVFEDYYVNTVPGWESVSVDEPPDLFLLLSGHRVGLERVSFDAGLHLFDPFTAVEVLPGDGSVFEFPHAPPLSGAFHLDLIYAVDVAGAEIGETYFGTFRLVDLAGLHGASAPFELGFRVFPEPGVLSLLGVASLLIRRGR
ncbi:MAG: hypothetical protein L6Q92_04745 [Phycisphaerae bacterium]|nr:hypothetical protein [Phycisphaerae bacterium]